MDICPVSIVALADLAGNFAPLRDYTEAVDTGATGGARFHLTPNGILFPKDARVPDPGFRIPRVGEKLNLALANR